MNIYHYCSNACFLSIISTRSIWASEFSLSNDLLEGKWIRRVFSDCCEDRKIPENERTGLLGMLDSLSEYIGAAGFCMSEESDLLSQWRAYSDNACGVSIGFNSDYLESLSDLKRDRNDDFNAALRQVEYEADRQRALIKDALEQIYSRSGTGAFTPLTLLTNTPEKEKERKDARRSLSLAMFLLFPNLYSFKNPAFREEREWRFISLVTPADTSQGFDIDRMDFRPLLDRIVPYRTIALENVGKNAIAE